MWVKQCHKPPIWEWFIQPIYGDLGDASFPPWRCSRTWWSSTACRCIPEDRWVNQGMLHHGRPYGRSILYWLTLTKTQNYNDRYETITPCLHWDTHQQKQSPKHLNWLVVSTPLKNISQLGWLFRIYGKIKHVPNHQPDYFYGPFSIANC